MEDISWLQLTILILASFRLTHLIVFDEITSFLRDPFLTVTYEPDESGQEVRKIEIKGEGWRYWAGSLLSCHWCMGIWSSLLLVALHLWVPASFPLLLALAVAGAAAFIESRVYMG
ncbi:uncharacterized protein DUF1360 [Melghirimyces profundicolus]|uniref:Uncharacterized protein DUF1360 n=1 Tax=Melghirimyces profundicolus TaxID=1242148 RepID=A0A2T6BW77_9BACL|nr:DUF1360 domain-containing protein [Melghirimyces profundicolus]PTX60328.1 uncharacterized protein DUF1360 [Melghirimyces profundicolus]